MKRHASEILWCELTIPNPHTKLLVGVFYRPPSSDVDYLQELERSLSLIECSGSNLATILLGDFNLPNIDWSTPSPTCHDNLSSVLCDITADYFFNQMVLNPTRGNNILDLIFTTAPELISDLEISAPLGQSDHHSIDFKLNLKTIRPKLSPRVVYDYRSANWAALREDFSYIRWDRVFLMETMDDVWEAWKTLFFQAVERNIPSKFVKLRRNSPWFNSKLKKIHP